MGKMIALKSAPKRLFTQTHNRKKERQQPTFRNKQKDFIEIKTHNGAEGNNEKLSSFFHSNLICLQTKQQIQN